MSITVKFFASFRNITGEKIMEIEIEDNSKLIDVLEKLFARFGNEFRNEILENEKLKRFVRILVNGRNIDFLNGLETPLENGDVLAMFPQIAGGSPQK